MANSIRRSNASPALEAAESTNTAPQAPSTVVEGTKRPYLIIIAGSHVGELHKVAKTRTVVGRDAAADIRIIDDGISREHLELLVEGERVSIRDLGSTNGTYCNGNRVEVREIADSDKISFGCTTTLKFTFQDGIDEEYQQRLYRSAIRDGLTQAIKREFFL